MSYVQVKGITKRFGDKTVLHNVDFTIQKGERFGLIGPNGAGKSTLIDIMTGLKKADTGEVTIDGKSIKQHPIEIRSMIGIVPQDIALIEELNAVDNLEYFGGMYSLKGKVLKERIDEALTAVGLEEKKKDKVKNYSGGMKRRLNIAAALLHHPQFLILDEPTVGVDAQSRQHIFDFLMKLNEQGTTILYISHYMEEVETLCDRLLVLDLGSEVAYGTKQQVKSLVSQSSKVRVILDRIPHALAENLMALDNGIQQVNIHLNEVDLVVTQHQFSMMKLIAFFDKTESIIKSISVEELSLEEVFLQLTGKKLRD
ncbi:ABC transporter ATP-binding protein [Aerococcaceae bacterium NML160702]|nr:ABC transporter ATP-binding protein [Aerococcaceae bacterium NML160702]